MTSLETRALQFIAARLSIATRTVIRERRSSVRRAARHLVHPALTLEGVRQPNDHHTQVQEHDVSGENGRGDALALEVVDRSAPATPTPSSLDERIVAALGQADRPLPFAELRTHCRVRAATLYQRLAVLAAAGRLVKLGDGYAIARS